jgi:hypothetical protein
LENKPYGNPAWKYRYRREKERRENVAMDFQKMESVVVQAKRNSAHFRHFGSRNHR